MSRSPSTRTLPRVVEVTWNRGDTDDRCRRHFVDCQRHHHPLREAIAGDYQITFRASSEDADASMEVRAQSPSAFGGMVRMPDSPHPGRSGLGLPAFAGDSMSAPTIPLVGCPSSTRHQGRQRFGSAGCPPGRSRTAGTEWRGKTTTILMLRTGGANLGDIEVLGLDPARNPLESRATSVICPMPWASTTA